MLIDAHNHWQDADLAPHHEAAREELLRARVGKMMVNGTQEADWPLVAAMTRDEPEWIHASYGLHPWYIASRSPQWLTTLRRFLQDDPRAAVGEIGLDRWKQPYDEEDQREVFAQQWALAVEMGRAVTVHCLRAWGPLLEQLRAAARAPRGFLLHAYGGSWEMTRPFLDLGAYFSFNGYFLHERKVAVREVYRKLPLDRLLVESDAPSMALPPAWRRYELPPSASGEEVNHPAHVAVAYMALAECRGLSVEALAEQVAENYRRLFGD